MTSFKKGASESLNENELNNTLGKIGNAIAEEKYFNPKQVLKNLSNN